MLKKSLIIKTDAKANENQIKIIDDIRITYLTSRLIRVEAGTFTDLASFTVLNRNFQVGKFNVKKIKNKIFVETSDVIFIIKNGTPICVKIKSSDETQYFKKQKTCEQHHKKYLVRNITGVFSFCCWNEKDLIV